MDVTSSRYSNHWVTVKVGSGSAVIEEQVGHVGEASTLKDELENVILDLENFIQSQPEE